MKTPRVLSDRPVCFSLHIVVLVLLCIAFPGTAKCANPVNDFDEAFQKKDYLISTEILVHAISLEYQSSLDQDLLPTPAWKGFCSAIAFRVNRLITAQPARRLAIIDARDLAVSSIMDKSHSTAYPYLLLIFTINRALNDSTSSIRLYESINPDIRRKCNFGRFVFDAYWSAGRMEDAISTGWAEELIASQRVGEPDSTASPVEKKFHIMESIIVAKTVAGFVFLGRHDLARELLTQSTRKYPEIVNMNMIEKYTAEIKGQKR